MQPSFAMLGLLTSAAPFRRVPSHRPSALFDFWRLRCCCCCAWLAGLGAAVLLSPGAAGRAKLPLGREGLRGVSRVGESCKHGHVYISRACKVARTQMRILRGVVYVPLHPCACSVTLALGLQHQLSGSVSRGCCLLSVLEYLWNVCDSLNNIAVSMLWCRLYQPSPS